MGLWRFIFCGFEVRSTEKAQKKNDIKPNVKARYQSFYISVLILILSFSKQFQMLDYQ